MSARDDDDETQVAAKHPLHPVDPRAYVPYDDDAIPDEDETLVALDRRAVPFDPRAMGRALPAIPTPPRPAAGMPATLPPPRPAAGMQPALPPPGVLPPPQHQTTATLPMAGPAGMHPPRATPVPQDAFAPVIRTLTLPQADPRLASSAAAQPGAPLPSFGGPTERLAPGLPPPSPMAAQALAAGPVVPLPAGEADVELASHDGMPPLVVRFLLVCGLLTVLGLLALIYLQL